MSFYSGIDGAEAHHDVAVVDDTSKVVGRALIGTEAARCAELLELLVQAGDTAEDPIPVATETDRGLVVVAPRSTGRPIYPINRLSALRYCACRQVSGAKSDVMYTVMLADILRTDAAAHRPLAAYTELAQAMRVLARAQKDFYPTALETFAKLPGIGTTGTGLARRDARIVLAAIRMLAEIGDDRTRFAEVHGFKAYVGSAPIIRAGGRKELVLHRHIKNKRLAAVGAIWALASLNASPGARRHFDARRASGDWNHQTQQHLFNTFLGQLHRCLEIDRPATSMSRSHLLPRPQLDF